MRSELDFFRAYVVSNPIAHSLWRCFECARFAREKLASPVLDVGCGDGFFTRTVFRRRLDWGVDPNDREVHRARRGGNYKRVLRAGVAALPLEDASVRTVISNCVLEHVPELDRGLSEIARVLKPGGRLLLTVPSEYYNRDSFYQRLFQGLGFNQAAQWYNRSLNRVFKHYHVHGWRAWERKLHAKGLVLEKAEYIMPRKAFRLYDQLLMLAVPGKILRALTGRWVLWPRPWLPGILAPLVRGFLTEQDDKGIVYFIVARKMAKKRGGRTPSA
ncbi:MAG TPA: class I SAM-dependent methyltransferase [bacterium]|nr:class I SAM-dependent methyltransferase [bacterium]